MKRITSLLTFLPIAIFSLTACSEQYAGASEDPNTIAEVSSSSEGIHANSSGDVTCDECSQTAPKENLYESESCNAEYYPIANTINASYKSCSINDTTNFYENVYVSTSQSNPDGKLEYILSGTFIQNSANCKKNHQEFAVDCETRKGTLREEAYDCLAGELRLACVLPDAIDQDTTLMRDLSKYASQWCSDMEEKASCPNP